MNQLNVLYRFNKEIISGSYEILFAFDSESFLDPDYLSDNFDSIEQLASYISSLLVDQKLNFAYILSVDEFNKALDSTVVDKESFSEVFEKFGTKLDLPQDRRSKGLFDRFF